MQRTHCGLAITGLILAIFHATAQPPPLPSGRMLTSWGFNDTNFFSNHGDAPRSFYGLDLSPSWNGNAVKISGANALLQYNDVETNGHTNITCDSGSLLLWFAPNWSSPTNGGMGPGKYGRLAEMGSYTTNMSIGWWSLYVDPTGSAIYFSANTNGAGLTYLTAPIAWSSNEWQFIGCTYSSSNSALYINGQLAATGPGISYFPNPSDRDAYGLTIGSDTSGTNLADGQFEWMITYNYPVSGMFMTNFYHAMVQWFSIPTSGGGDGLQGGSSFGDLPSSGGGGESFGPEGSGGCTGLCLEIALTTSEAVLTLRNTGPDTNYMFFSRESVASGIWKLEAEAPGLPETNAITVRVLRGSRTNLFFVAGSGNDSDGDGLPDAYEALVTKTDPFDGDSGDTGLPDGYKDTDGDGWTDAEEFRLGQSPFVANLPPPAITGIYQIRDSSGFNVVEWNLPTGTPTSFAIERKTGSTWESAGTVTGDITTFVDTGLAPNTSAEYRVRANYPSGSSDFLSTELTAPNTTEASYTVPAIINTGPGGRLYFMAGQPLNDLDGFVITREPILRLLPADRVPTLNTNYVGGYFFTNSLSGLLLATNVSTNWVLLSTNFLPHHAYYRLRVRALAKDGRFGNIMTFDQRYATPFLDGREHLLDNLSFVTRGVRSGGQYDFWFSDYAYQNTSGRPYGMFPNYGFAGFHWKASGWQTSADPYDSFQPFSDSSVLRALCYDPADFDAYGDPLAAGYGSQSGPLLPMVVTSDYFFNSLYFNSYKHVIAGNTNVPARTIPRELSPQILYRPGNDADDLSAIGLTWNSDARRWDMASGTRNYYGLPIIGVRAVKQNTAPGPLLTYSVQPGGNIPAFGTTTEPGSGWFYAEAAQPLFVHAGFYFSAGLLTRDGPGSNPPFWPGPIDRTNAYILGHGAPTRFYVWSRHTLANGYTNNSFYLQQYFDKAYKVDATGQVTTNETGLLSEYGDFVPTEPGRLVLTTKPDLTGGLTATVSVHVIKLQLDVNHDGVMDDRFASPDNTTSGKPFVFWVNNDYDRWHQVDCTPIIGGNCDEEEDDLHIADRDLVQRAPDYAYTNTVSPMIASMRDLEDYARLWTVGITNLLPDLPSNAVVELAWRTTSSQNPTLRIFRAIEPQGGTGYLTDTNLASAQVNTIALYKGLVTPTQPLQLNEAFSPATDKYIFCGASRGKGELVLRIRIGTSVLGETSAFVEIKEVKEMYERWIAGDSPSREPFDYARPPASREDLPSGISAFRYSYSPARDTNTAYILFVHGWNMTASDKDRFAESAFKRLYWQGYQGRFGLFRWPTTFNFPLRGVEGDGFNPNNFDRGEFQGWKAARCLVRLLGDLNRMYPGQVRMFAHSQGGIVAGEALRLPPEIGELSPLVSTYIAMQTAIPSHSYDPTAPLRDIPFLADDGTPNLHANYAGQGVEYFTFAPGAATYVNFYNPVDWAVDNWWKLAQDLRPDELSGYYWDNVPNTFTHQPQQGNTRILSIPQDTYEIFAFGVEARCFGLGTQAGVGGAFDPEVEVLLDPTFDFGNRHKGHSAQFRSTNMKRAPFWDEVLKTFALKPRQ